MNNKPANAANCTKGAKQPLYWYQKERNNVSAPITMQWCILLLITVCLYRCSKERILLHCTMISTTSRMVLKIISSKLQHVSPYEMLTEDVHRSSYTG